VNNFYRPRIIVSKCLEFESCRYNGQMIPDEFVSKLKKNVDFIPVCPEVEIGLGVPRNPIRIVNTDGKNILYQPATGMDVTKKMEKFISGFIAHTGSVDGFILKHISPSCGISDVKIYSGMNNNSKFSNGPGFFGEAVLENYKNTAVENEERLKNFSIREHFLTRIFASARFQEMKQKKSMNELVTFHTHQKLLLMGYNQSKMRELGRIIANKEKADITAVMNE